MGAPDFFSPEWKQQTAESLFNSGVKSCSLHPWVASGKHREGWWVCAECGKVKDFYRSGPQEKEKQLPQEKVANHGLDRKDKLAGDAYQPAQVEWDSTQDQQSL